MNTIAEAWNTGNTRKAAECYTVPYIADHQP